MHGMIEKHDSSLILNVNCRSRPYIHRVLRVYTASTVRPYIATEHIRTISTCLI